MDEDLFNKNLNCETMEWQFIEEDYKAENNYRNETIFSTGNGYIGMRGNFEEGISNVEVKSVEGTYINGIYGKVTNGKIIKLFIGEEEFNMLSGSIEKYERTLNFKDGILKRTLVWSSPSGNKVLINCERIVSLDNKNLVAIRYEVTSINYSGVIKLISEINDDFSNCLEDKLIDENILQIENKKIVGNYAVMVEKSVDSKFSVACAMENELQTDCMYCMETKSQGTNLSIEYDIKVSPSSKIVLNKYIAYTDLSDCQDCELASKAKTIVNLAKVRGYDYLKLKQSKFLEEFWENCDIEIKGNSEMQQAVRFNIFKMIQSVGKEGATNISAKGITGEGYSEIYLIPLFTYTNPKVSRKLLEYRYNIIDEAKQHAKNLSHNKGAVFACRKEDSSNYSAREAKYHINGDIAFAIKSYMDATEDMEFLIKYGAEILFETARLWVELGEFSERKGNKFCIFSVEGPDEYSSIGNNNFYTNLMAKENLEYAYEVSQLIKQKNKSAYDNLLLKIDLKEEEFQLWKAAAENMYLPFDEKLKLIPQDDNFLEKPIWDFEATPIENYPLFAHYHPLEVFRHQVCKQPDIILAMYLFHDKFTKTEKKINYDYYKKITTNDSVFTQGIFSIVASELGYNETAYEFFKEVSRMDNLEERLQSTNMAGTWFSIVLGFAGMRKINGDLSFDPYIPEQWQEYSFKVNYRGRLIKVIVDKNGTSYKLIKGEAIKIISKGEERVLN